MAKTYKLAQNNLDFWESTQKFYGGGVTIVVVRLNVLVIKATERVTF